MSRAPSVLLRLDAVIVAVTEEVPRILAVPAGRGDGESGAPALPYGLLDPLADTTLEQALRRWVREQAGLGLGYVEQLYSFGDLDREPRQRSLGRRVVSVAYLALVREERPSVAEPTETPAAGGTGARWLDWYRFFPWEDWRLGRPALLAGAIEPALDAWVKAERATRRARRERADITFGLNGAPWDGERVLERYELLYEAGLVAEAERDRVLKGGAGRGSRTPAPLQGAAPLGHAMAFDHRRILATALGRLRGKLRYRPVVFELLPATFTLFQLQRLVEALAGLPLHKANFRRLVEKGGLVEGTGRIEARTGGRPAELFRFRREVLRERPAPGVGLPGRRG